MRITTDEKLMNDANEAVWTVIVGHSSAIGRASGGDPAKSAARAAGCSTAPRSVAIGARRLCFHVA